jgi:hypothetical protein
MIPKRSERKVSAASFVHGLLKTRIPVMLSEVPAGAEKCAGSALGQEKAAVFV